MPKILFSILLSGLLSLSAAAQQLPGSPALAAKSWLLIDASSTQVLATQASEERLEPASLTKLMTAYLTFAALKQGKIAREQPVLISEKAWKAPGSRMFIKVNTQVKVDDLIKGMIVQSGNDASIALAELVGSDEEGFVKLMNQEAQRLGMKNSQFRNPTGLPDPEHYTTAHDLSLLARALIHDFPSDYGTYYSIKEFRYNNITQPNRNRLLWLDSSVDGMKTGFTDAAGYCLISSAKRGNLRLLSIVLGATSERARIQESLKLLNFGFQSYEAVKLYAKNEAVSSLKVWKGAASVAKAGFAEDLILSVPKGMAGQLKSELVSTQPLIAPVLAGQVIGTLKVKLGDKAFGDYPVIALEAVPVSGIFGRIFDTIRLWFN